MQQSPGDQIMSIGEVNQDAMEPEGELDSWQTYFSKQFSNLLIASEKKVTTKCKQKNDRMFGQILCVPNSNNSKERWVRETSARVEGIK